MKVPGVTLRVVGLLGCALVGYDLLGHSFAGYGGAAAQESPTFEFELPEAEAVYTAGQIREAVAGCAAQAEEISGTRQPFSMRYGGLDSRPFAQQFEECVFNRLEGDAPMVLPVGPN